MRITKVTATYSRSINTRNYGIPESWIKIESTYEAEVWQNEDPLEVSRLLADQVRKEVVDNTNAIIEKIKLSSGMITAPAPVAPVMAPAPVQVETQPITEALVPPVDLKPDTFIAVQPQVAVAAPEAVNTPIPAPQTVELPQALRAQPRTL